MDKISPPPSPEPTHSPGEVHEAFRVPDRRIERLAALMNELRNDPAHAKTIAYADLLVSLCEAYEAAERYATEHKLTPSPSDYLKENTTHA